MRCTQRHPLGHILGMEQHCRVEAGIQILLICLVLGADFTELGQEGCHNCLALPTTLTTT